MVIEILALGGILYVGCKVLKCGNQDKKLPTIPEHPENKGKTENRSDTEVETSSCRTPHPEGTIHDGKPTRPTKAVIVGDEKVDTEKPPRCSAFWETIKANTKLQHHARAIKPVPRHNNLPLSFGQERLWSVDQLNPDSTVHNLRSAYRFKGRLDVDILEKSLRAIGQRHETLRTIFPAVGGRPVQIILPYAEFQFPIVDLGDPSSGAPPGQQENQIRRFAMEEAQRPFDLAKGPLVRFKLLRLTEEEHILLMTIHHIINDRWSISLFMRELATHYRAFTTGEFLPLPSLPIQYADFAQFQRQWLQKEVLGIQLDYWKKQLGGDLPILALPADYPEPAVPTYQGGAQYLELPASLISALKGLGSRQGVSLFIVLLAAFKTLLYRYSGQQDIIVCSPVAGRYRLETKKLIGYFSNLVLLRTDLGNDPDFSTLLDRVGKIALGANEHQDLPFQQLADTLRIPGPILSRALFSLQNVPNQPRELAPGVSIGSVDVEEGIANFDLFLSMRPKAEAMICVVRYKTALFAAPTIKQMLDNFHALLARLVAEPNCRLSELPRFGTQDLSQSPDATSPDVPYVSPRSETEKTIASIWQEVFKKEKIGIDTNFFDIGGRSLTMMPICMKLQDVFKRDIPVAELFKYPTVAGMARYIDEQITRVEHSAPLIHSRAQKQRMALGQHRQWSDTQGPAQSSGAVSVQVPPAVPSQNGTGKAEVVSSSARVSRAERQKMALGQHRQPFDAQGSCQSSSTVSAVSAEAPPVPPRNEQGKSKVVFPSVRGSRAERQKMALPRQPRQWLGMQEAVSIP
ncbi:MAG: Phosphopantetheine attachment site [Candidatus Kentron sp. G]|nr:MAG: Phosphopantetheine attachment site [Candidatus Kentron sp. G]